MHRACVINKYHGVFLSSQVLIMRSNEDKPVSLIFVSFCFLIKLAHIAVLKPQVRMCIFVLTNYKLLNSHLRVIVKFPV